jgi:hypothetical protein
VAQGVGDAELLGQRPEQPDGAERGPWRQAKGRPDGGEPGRACGAAPAG